ncbi:MAG: C10 family peptidase [Prevotella sp.]|nr:C10 family peptidase [Prevotella sp.]
MRKILLLISLFTCISMLAGPVDQEAAKQKAINFVTAKMGVRAQRSMRATASGVNKASNRAATRDYLHVFNMDGGGFVIVSGDDRTEEILGYSTTGFFDAEKMPDNMRAFLQEYVDGIQALDDAPAKVIQQKVKHGYPSMRVSSRATKTSISPLMTTLWDQGEPYDQYCPTYSGEKAATGCVATAMAQVMGYHKWPNATTTEIPAFSTDTRHFSCSAIPAGTAINWSNIKNYYGWYCVNDNWINETYTDAQAAAVAKLMQLCGYSVQMDYYCDNYGQSGAATSDCIPALIKYFDYEESTCQWVNRENYSYSDWQDIIYEELAAKRPVLYSGRSSGGGHAFVCDGYDSDDFFHINWGWAGMSNGNFRLRLLDPDNQGIGGSSTSDGYGMGQGAGIGIQKNDGTSTPYVDKMSVYNLTMSQTSFTRTSSSSNFNLSGVTYYIINSTGSSQTFDLGTRILDSKGNTVEDLGPMITNRNLGTGYYTWASYIPAFGANYANGNYKLVFIARPSASSGWYVCQDGDLKCIDFVISGNTLTVASPVLECSHTVEGELAANSTVTIKLSVKNTGTKGFRTDLYYYVNGGNKTAAGFVDAEPGETDVVEIKYTPTAEGTYTFTFDELDYTFDITVGAGAPAATLSGTYNYASPSIQYDSSTGGYYVDGTTTTANFTVKNTGEGAYNDDIVFNFFYYSTSAGEWKYYKEARQTISLAAGATQNLNVAIDKVDNSDYAQYCVEMCWLKNNDETYLATTPDFEFREASGAFNLGATYTANPVIQTADLNGDGVNDYYVDGMNTHVTFNVKNTGSGSFSGKLVIDYLYHKVSEDQWYYCQDDTEKELTLAAGASTTIDGTISYYNNSDYDLYRVRLWYNDGSWNLITETPNFEFRPSSYYQLKTANEGSTPELQYNSGSDTYYVNGTSVEFYVDVTNTGNSDFSGQLMIEQAIHHAGGGNSWYYKDYPTYPEYRDFTLAAGSTKRISTTVTKSEETDVDNYFVRVRYKGSDDTDYIVLERTPNFVFVDANAPQLVFEKIEYMQEFLWDAEAGHHYVEGNQLTADFYASNIGGGDFNGQARLKYWGHNTSSDSWEQIKDATTHTFNVAAGGTNYVRGTIEKDDNHDLYSINWYYIDPTSGAEIFLRRTSDNEFRAATIKPGDANGDGQVNVTDIVAVVNYIMGNPPADFNFSAANVNGDEDVNVTDIVSIVNIIMSSGARIDTEEVYRILKANGFIFKGE